MWVTLLSVSSRRADSFPLSSSRFVGRTVELATIAAKLEKGARLVTLWGPAGMGKTRLAIETARARRDRYAGDAFFCEIESARDGASFASAVARSVGLTGLGAAAGDKLVAAIGDALAARGPMLLVLDNLEQVLSPAAKAIEVWLERAPEMTILATSRERTRATLEVDVEVAPLGLEHGAGAVSEAVELFFDRVNAARLGPPLDAKSASEIAPLVAKLEGIPLAIELAAARFPMFGLGMIARLERRLAVLGGGRGVPARQATLRGAIEWSWEIIDDAERRALARLSVFRGGFSIEAAGAVLDGLGGLALDLVQSLRDKSLLFASPSANPLSPVRFGLLEGVRELAAEKLLELEADRAAARDRHAGHFLEVGETASHAFDGDGSIAALDALALEIDNHLAVLDHARTAEEALRAALLVDTVATTRGPLGAHSSRVEEVVARAETEERLDAKLLARGLAMRGRLRTGQGAVDLAERDFVRARELAESASDTGLVARALVDLGLLRHTTGDLEAARELYGRALEIFRKRGDVRAEARALGNLGAVHHDTRSFDDAIRHYESALAILAPTRDRRLQGIFSTNLGVLEQEKGVSADAARRFERALAWLEEAGDARLVGFALGNLASLQHEEGKLEEAQKTYARSLLLLREAGDRRSEALGLARLGAVQAALGAIDESRASLERATRLAESTGAVLATDLADLNRAFIDVELAVRAARERRDDDRKKHLAAAAERVAHAKEGAAERGDDVRTSLRLLERSLAALTERDDGGARARDPDAAAPDEALLVAPEARWIRPPGASWCDLRQRAPARRLFMKLLEQQRATPGHGVSMDTLREAGWPGERIRADAAANRIYVALNQLRKLGLKELLLKTQDGYMLDPKVKVHSVAVEPN